MAPVAPTDSGIFIDEEFQSLIPPPSDLERLQLEDNILREGCRDPLVVWLRDGKSVLLDGHNRLEICERNGIDFSLVELEFASRDRAKEWLYLNQLGRRNLSPADMSELRGRLYNGRKKSHGGARKASPQNEDLKTAESVAKETGVSKATIERDGKYAEAVDTVAQTVPDIRQRVREGDVTKSEVVEAAKSPAKAAEILTKPHVSNNSGNNEWYTPAEYCDAAHAVMGGIDLDPASCEIANKQVRATRFFTVEQDALRKQWKGRVWLNPPYGQPLIVEFCNKFLSEWTSGRIAEAIVLVNNATETGWCQSLISVAAAVCFKSGRVRFLDATGTPANTPLQGQLFLYFGENVTGFSAEFMKYGVCR